jgi:hypothetical protein
MTKIISVVARISTMGLAVVSLQCTSETSSVMTSTQAATIAVDASAESVLCEARISTIVANTGNVVVNSGTLVDSYESSQGNYGGSNVGNEAVVQAATKIVRNGGTIRGTTIENTRAGFPTLRPPAGAKNLPLGASSPGSLNINSAQQSITLAPGDYVATWVNINGSGAINVAPGGGVRIWVTGGLSTGGVVNGQGTPANLAFVLPNAGWVNLNGGQFHGLLYAPTSNVNVNGSVFGTIVGKSVTLNSGGSVHFDLDALCGGSSEAEIDQSLTVPGGALAGVYGPGSFMAQTFTAGFDGALVGAAVSINSFTSDVARVQVRTVENGVPSETILGEGSATAAGNLSINTMIEFQSPIAQVGGEQYALVVNYPQGPPFVDNMPSRGDWVGAQDNPYSGGVIAYTNDGGQNWTSLESSDLLFQTFVIAD